MPLLPTEPMFAPDNLFSIARTPVAGERRWWVLHTRPRAEKALARHCRARQIAYFLPQFEQRNRVSGRVRVSHLPVFPSYLFLFGTPDCRVGALESNQVANSLPVADQNAFFAQIAAVQQVVASGADVLPEEGLRPGTPVAIITGPFAGLVGKVIRQGTKSRLYVEIPMLNRGMSVEIETSTCRPLPAKVPERTLAGV